MGIKYNFEYRRIVKKRIYEKDRSGNIQLCKIGERRRMKEDGQKKMGKKGSPDPEYWCSYLPV